MATLQELRKERLEKLEKLRSLGVNPYPADSVRTHEIGEVVDNFDKLEGQEVTVCGRILALRRHGGVVFADCGDLSGNIQLYIKEDVICPAEYTENVLGFADLALTDIGDFVEATGEVTKTQRGEISVEVSRLRLLAKSLRPLPDKYHGLTDKETRLRRRYLDLVVNEDVRERFIRRTRFWQAHRDFFDEREFLEINIPVLEHTPGGADANPFVTHMDALDQDFYLRISQELYLKRLIGGGYERVYEIGPRFRNEGVSDEHLPEHIAMEFYWAYASFEQGIEMVKDLFRYILDAVYEGRRVFSIRGFEVDFGKEWERIDFSEIMRDRYGIDVLDTSLQEVHGVLGKHGVKIGQPDSFGRCVDGLWKEIRREIAGPAILVYVPKYLSPLAKSKPSDERIVERFHPIIAGSELGNGFSELNDPLDQLKRFREQQKLRDSGDAEAQFLDIDFVEMLEYGMPPTLGYGHSERVFWFLEDVTAREGVPFPQLRYELDETTKKIYGLK